MSTEALQTAGPLLSRLLDVQSLEKLAVEYGQIEALADAVLVRAADLCDCLIWPVGAAAERVAGVITVRSRGRVEVGAWNTAVRGRRLILLAVAGVSPLSLETTADQLRRRGAVEVHGCGVDVAGAEVAVGLDSYLSLGRNVPGRSSLALIGDAA